MPTLIDFESNEQRAVTTVLGECRQGCTGFQNEPAIEVTLAFFRTSVC